MSAPDHQGLGLIRLQMQGHLLLWDAAGWLEMQFHEQIRSCSQSPERSICSLSRWPRSRFSSHPWIVVLATAHPRGVSTATEFDRARSWDGHQGVGKRGLKTGEPRFAESKRES